jgi:hypothetical protein
MVGFTFSPVHQAEKSRLPLIKKRKEKKRKEKATTMFSTQHSSFRGDEKAFPLKLSMRHI